MSRRATASSASPPPDRRRCSRREVFRAGVRLDPLLRALLVGPVVFLSRAVWSAVLPQQLSIP